MNTYKQPSVDYYSMLIALEHMSRQAWDRSKLRGLVIDKAWQVADYKTIGFHVARQCGASWAINTWIHHHPGKCLLINKDSKLGKAQQQNYRERFPTDPTDNYMSATALSNGLSQLDTNLTEGIRYVIVDDASYLMNSAILPRAEFNKWVAENFHEDTFVILVK